MVLFLGTDAELTTSEWSQQEPTFFIGAPSEGEAPVRRHFSTPNVYVLGAHTGCGCGYGYGQDPEWYAWAAEFPEEADPDPDPLEPVSRRQLADFLRQLVDEGHTVDVYACWSGDEAQQSAGSLLLTPEAFLDPSCIREGDFAVVTASPQVPT